MIQVSREIADQKEDKVHYEDFLDRSFQVVGTRTATKLAGPSTHVFVAEPRTLTITNFLGVQNIININYRRDLPQGLTFLVGDNGTDCCPAIGSSLPGKTQFGKEAIELALVHHAAETAC
ncbi:hypothetical protein BHE90_017472 [Fusarium euwallaceae]|uniref:Uncharacterized protein n=1 Tax=Fusarium euwallaceae TaxID=1147111 RepID=A0A430KXD2_9HYPO|nr:hypothetical protein BHE90_017472 [Fusarium euwallaceae]